METFSVARRGLMAGLLVFTAAVSVHAQGVPKAGPAHQKLAYYVGNWTSEGELKPNPFMPQGKYTSTDHCEWFEGGFAVICHSQGKGPMGATKGVGILGYSGEEKVYTYYGIDNSGMVPTTVGRGTIVGDTWTYVDESKMGGNTVKSRYSLKHISPTSYSFKWEMQSPGGNWMTLMEGSSTKTK